MKQCGSEFIGTDIDKIYSHFGQIYNFYPDTLVESVLDQIKEGSIEPVIEKDFYNYLLIDADKFYRILEKYNFNLEEISNEDFESLKKCIFYVGKGRNGRKFNHMTL